MARLCCTVGPAPEEAQGEDALDAALREALAAHSVKDAASLVATALALPRRAVYARAMALAREGARDDAREGAP